MFMTFISINGKEIRMKTPFCKKTHLCKYFGIPMVHKTGRVLNVMREMYEMYENQS